MEGFAQLLSSEPKPPQILAAARIGLRGFPLAASDDASSDFLSALFRLSAIAGVVGAHYEFARPRLRSADFADPAHSEAFAAVAALPFAERFLPLTYPPRQQPYFLCERFADRLLKPPDA